AFARSVAALVAAVSLAIPHVPPRIVGVAVARVLASLLVAFAQSALDRFAVAVRAAPVRRAIDRSAAVIADAVAPAIAIAISRFESLAVRAAIGIPAAVPRVIAGTTVAIETVPRVVVAAVPLRIGPALTEPGPIAVVPGVIGARIPPPVAVCAAVRLRGGAGGQHEAAGDDQHGEGSSSRKHRTLRSAQAPRQGSRSMPTAAAGGVPDIAVIGAWPTPPEDRQTLPQDDQRNGVRRKRSASARVPGSLPARARRAAVSYAARAASRRPCRSAS